METSQRRLVFENLLPVLCVAAWLLAQPHPLLSQEEPRRWVIEAVGTETVRPDVIHLMMKMEYESGLAAHATSKGEEQLREFLAAVDRLKIPHLTHRVSNHLLTPAQSGRGTQATGFVYTRNIVFTLSESGREPGALDPVIAQLEDLAARYNSHCVTCIGSG